MLNFKAEMPSAKSPFVSNARVASFTFLTPDSLRVMSFLVSEDPAGWAGCTLGQKNREMVKQKSAKPGANTAQCLLLPRERVCKAVIRGGRTARGMGGPPEEVIWMPTYLAPALQGGACKCFRGRASCGLWFRELTQIVSEPFFMGLQRSALSGELEPVVLGVILSCLAGSRLCSEQAAMAADRRGGFSILQSLCCVRLEWECW